MADLGGEFSFFQGIDVRIDKNFHFHEIYGHQILQAGTYKGIDSNETNQERAGDFITSRSRDKLKYISTTKVNMGTKLGIMVT